VNANLPLSQVNLASGAAPAGTADGPGASAVIFPTTGGATIPVVAGGLYMFQGLYALSNTAGSGYAIDIAIENGASDVTILKGQDAALTAIGQFYYDLDIPFSAMFIASGSTCGINLINSGSAGTNGTIVNFNALYLTRIA
jgi:hypothetical protein